MKRDFSPTEQPTTALIPIRNRISDAWSKRLEWAENGASCSGSRPKTWEISKTRHSIAWSAPATPKIRSTSNSSMLFQRPALSHSLRPISNRTTSTAGTTPPQTKAGYTETPSPPRAPTFNAPTTRNARSPTFDSKTASHLSRGSSAGNSPPLFKSHKTPSFASVLPDNRILKSSMSILTG